MTGFLDTEIAPAIKPTPQNKGQNVLSPSSLSKVLKKNSDDVLSVYDLLTN